jgi:hypothetical protein
MKSGNHSSTPMVRRVRARATLVASSVVPAQAYASREMRAGFIPAPRAFVRLARVAMDGCASAHVIALGEA